MKYSWLNANTFHPSFHTQKKDYFLILFSHIANLIPIVFAIVLHLPRWFVYILILQTLFSLLYHAFFKEPILRIIDWIFAISLIISNCIILFNNQHYLDFKIVLILILAIIGFRLFFSFKNYAHKHSIWHIVAATISTIVQL